MSNQAKCKQGLNTEIAGHTDNIGTGEYNLTLSRNRAYSVYQHMVNNGVDANTLTYHGYGSSQPNTSNETVDGRAENRRIELKIIK